MELWLWFEDIREMETIRYDCQRISMIEVRMHGFNCQGIVAVTWYPRTTVN